MADVKISGLPASTVPLAGTEVLPIVQGGVTKQVSVNNLTAGKAIEGLGLTLTSTDAGASQAPTIDLYRDSASPAASDTIGEIEFNGEDSAGNKQAYALLHGSILSPTSGAEQGQLHFETATAGALTEKMIIGTANLVINEPGNIFNVRIEGDTDANLLYTDATNSRVGIGTISPSTKLDVNGSLNVAGAATISPANAAVAISPTGTGTVTINPAAASTMNNVAIGATTALAGRFTGVTSTDLTASTAVGADANKKLVSLVQPAFSAYMGAGQALSAITNTKLQYNTEVFDTNSNYDPTTNYRFTPTVAGYYQINACYTGASSTAGDFSISISINGTAVALGGFNSGVTGGFTISPTTSVVAYFNGSTDYVEVFAYVQQAQTLQSGVVRSFNGCFLRGA
jgi:hypothetical protein